MPIVSALMKGSEPGGLMHRIRIFPQNIIYVQLKWFSAAAGNCMVHMLIASILVQFVQFPVLDPTLHGSQPSIIPTGIMNSFTI